MVRELDPSFESEFPSDARSGIGLGAAGFRAVFRSLNCRIAFILGFQEEYWCVPGFKREISDREGKGVEAVGNVKLLREIQEMLEKK